MEVELRFEQEGCREFEPFTYKTMEALQNELNDLGIELPFISDFGIFKHPLKTDKISFANRLGIQPMEGFDAKKDGSPTFLTVRRYSRYARGGAGTIWCEATSISQNYKSNVHQLVITEKNVDEYSKFVKFIKSESQKVLDKLGFSESCILILQLNHSGRYCKYKGKPYPIRAFHNDSLDNAINASRLDGKVISDKELEELEQIWVKKAMLARKAGFDGVDIKACHGYLISELLSARERKNSKYGGKNFKDRSRFYLNIIKELREKIVNNDNFIIATRLGIYDGIPYPYGFGVKKKKGEKFPFPIDLTEPIQLIKKLYDLDVRLINISAGNPHYRPHITRPYDIPVKGNKTPSEHPLCSVFRLVKMTSKIRKSISKDITLIGSGYSYLRQYATYICAGLLKEKIIDICGFGRMAFANPNFPKQIFLDGSIDAEKVCIACSQCSQLMKNGKSTGCVIRDDAYELK